MTAFQINRGTLAAALQSMWNIIPSKPSRDVLKCVHITAGFDPDHHIKIQSTDLEIFARVTLDSDVFVTTPGSFVTPAQTLLDYVKSLDSDSIDFLAEKEDALKINEAGTNFTVGLQDLDEFPDFPQVSIKDSYQLETEDIAHSLQHVEFAVADRDTVNGVV